MFEFNIKKHFLFFLTISKPFILTITIYCLLLFKSQTGQADEMQNITSQQDLIIRNQQNFNEFESRQKEQKNIQDDFDQKRSQSSDIDLESSENENIGKNKCKIIQQLIISNAENLSTQTKDRITAEIVGQCFSNKKISKIIERITNIYDQKGYVTAEFEMLQDRLNKGIIEIKVTEKTIEKIILNYSKSPPNSLSYKLQKLSAFGFIEGKKLNGNDLAQGLYQINRLQSNNANYQIINSVNRDSNIVIVNNQKKFPVHFSASHDNLGNKSTGIYRSSFHSSFDNILALNENINLSYSTNLNDNQAYRDIKTYAASLYFPLAYYSLSLDGSKSDFFGLDSLNRNFSGYSSRYNVTLNKLLIENLDYRFSAKIGITQKETASYLQQIKVNNSQRRLTILNANILATYFIDQNTTIYFKPSIAQGLGILGAYRDYNYKNPQLNFTILRFYSSLQRNFYAFNFNKPILLVSEIDSQISNKTLFGSEQISIGGYTTVRGFRERNIAGEKGFYWRNKLQFNLGSIMQKTALAPNHHLSRTKIEPFIDFGHIRQQSTNKSTSIAGTGFKTIYSNNYFSASLTMSWALQQSRLISNAPKENKMIYFEISTKCCLF
jgi:hemolysin activation/secretion protein